MVSIRDAVLSAVCAMSLAVAAPAQGSLEVGDRVLPAGGDIEITYSNPGMAGQLAVVRIQSGAGDEAVVLIQLNGNGSGGNSWSVPYEWDIAFFLAPQSPELMCVIGECGI